tara:strand:+ start:1345 stop:1713 length:369 start_codon:yes stop_codon:yes gene_type:complete
MARPERKFTDEEIDEIEELGPVLTHDQLAEYFSITAKTLREIFKRDQRVFTAYTKSRMKAGMLAVNTLKEKAIVDKDFQSLKLYLSHTMDWTEKSRQEITGAGGGPVEQDVEVTITVIGADD